MERTTSREVVTNETKLGEVDGNLFQFPAKFVVMNTTSTELMHLEGKVLSIRDQFTFLTLPEPIWNYKEEDSQASAKYTG